MIIYVDPEDGAPVISLAEEMEDWRIVSHNKVPKEKEPSE